MPFLINGALFSFDISLNAFMPNHMMAPDKMKICDLANTSLMEVLSTDTTLLLNLVRHFLSVVVLCLSPRICIYC
jgi:hypothetical protein